MRKALFLDRDGVLNKKPPEHDYVKSLDELFILPAIGEALKIVKDKGFKIIVVSNQRGVAKGLVTEQTLDQINGEINKFLEPYSCQIEHFFYCPHNERECDCRKPLPGLFFQAEKKLKIDLSKSYFVGDSDADSKAGIAAGIKTFIIPTDSSLLDIVNKIN